jgi:hypothetical protein
MQQQVVKVLEFNYGKMVYTNLDSAQTGGQKDVITDFSVPAQSTDAATGQKKTEWTNQRASEYLGYYKSIPELKIAIDAKATWTIGKGFTSNPITTLFLGTIKGNGKDSFNSILENLVRDYHIYGDAFAEIVREGERIINLKPLDPSTIKTIANEKGIIVEYEQSVSSGEAKKFTKENMFHLMRNRVADEIHGVSIIDAVEWIILARNEAMTDYRKLLHRNVYPVRVWHLDSDNDSKIALFKAKVAASKGEGEDIFVPKGAVQSELASVPANASFDPKSWIQMLNNYFYQAVGVPQIIIGGSQEITQTAGQVAYLAFEQTIEEAQLFIEEQVLNQLNLEINLTFPASLQNNLLSDQAKDGTLQQLTNQPNKLIPQMMRK